MRVRSTWTAAIKSTMMQRLGGWSGAQPATAAASSVRASPLHPTAQPCSQSASAVPGLASTPLTPLPSPSPSLLLFVCRLLALVHFVLFGLSVRLKITAPTARPNHSNHQRTTTTTSNSPRGRADDKICCVLHDMNCNELNTRVYNRNEK